VSACSRTRIEQPAASAQRDKLAKNRLTLARRFARLAGMKLQDYLDEASLTRAQFAELIGVDAETLRRYIIGRRIPDKERMVRIALATGCKVTANDFFGIVPTSAAS
jgi:DNA-binding transcriptional regulator YiaG